MSDSNKNPETSRKLSRNRGGGWLGFILGFLAVILGVYFALGGFGVGGADQKEAKAKIRSLGGVAMMDSSKKYITTVNLLAVSDPAKFAEAVEILGGLPKLSSLNISNTPVTSEQLAEIGRLTQLSALTAKDCRIDDKGLNAISGLRNLETLYLVGTDITSASLPTISGFRKLKILDLSYNEGLTGGFGGLKGLPKLDWLLLNGLKMKDGSLSQLSQLSSLNRLNISETEVDPGVVESLKAAVSGLKIN